MAPQVVYSQSGCPHAGCDRRMQAIGFCPEELGRSLVAAWWNDAGFVGRFPKCRGRIHLTIREKRAIMAEETQRLPQLPDDWVDAALIL